MLFKLVVLSKKYIYIFFPIIKFIKGNSVIKAHSLKEWCIMTILCFVVYKAFSVSTFQLEN